MLRDFSDEKKSELTSAVEAAEASGFWGIVDWVQDWFIKDKISDYGDDIADYHRNIIDKKGTTLQQLDAIFFDVYTVEMRYTKTFSTSQDRMMAISESISSIADILDPSPADGGGLVLLRPQSVLNSMFDPIKKVVESEAFYQALRESKNSDEMFITSVGVIYKGELYPFSEIGPVEITEGQQFTNPMNLVHSNVLDDAKFSFAEFIVGWLGGEPNSVDLDNPEYNNSVTDGVTMLRPAGETPMANGIDFALSGINAALGAIDKYYVEIGLYQTADGRNVAVINLTSNDYNTWRQSITTAPVYKDAILPDGRTGVLQIQYDQARANNPYVATIGVDSNGMLVAQPHVYAGDTVIAGSEDIFGNFTPYTVPLSTYEPNAPEAVLNTPTPWDVTDDYLRPESLIINDVFLDMLGLS